MSCVTHKSATQYQANMHSTPINRPSRNGSSARQVGLNGSTTWRAVRIPDPTTAGDFCRRFTPADIEALQDVFNKVRQGVWRQQPDSFFHLAVGEIGADGLGVEIVLGAADEFQEAVVFVALCLRRVGIGFALLRQKCFQLALRDRAGGGVQIVWR